MRRLLLALMLGSAVSCACAQTAPSPADVGISKGTPDVFKLKGHDNVWTPFGSVDPSTHIFAPGTNGAIAPNDCLKWGPGITSAGAACGSGGGSGSNQLTIYTSHSGLVNNVTTPTEAWTVVQQGFRAPGDGGEATYNWSFTSYCGGGTSSSPMAADGLSCVLPIGQSPSTAGRYLMNITNDSVNVMQFGMQPGGQDNSPYVNPLMTAIATNLFTSPGISIVFPPVMGKTAYYYFSEPFTISNGGNISCGHPNIDLQGPVVLLFAGGVDGFRQENGQMTFDGGQGVGDISGCALMSLGGGAGNSTAGGNTVTDISPTNYTPPNHDFTPPSDCNSLAGGPCFPGAGDGFIVSSHYHSAVGPAVAPGAYISSVNTTTNTATLASPYTIGTLTGSGVQYWDLPAKQKYTVNTAIGSSLVTVVSGPRLLRPGDKVWSDAFPLGSTVIDTSNVLLGTPTVAAGGSGYVGASGTMTWTGPGCSSSPVLNVTASGGAITAVSSVASAGQCIVSTPPTASAQWTPGGGLSGGSGAKFNTTYQQSSNITDVTMYNYVNASVTHTSGSGQLWVIPAGIARRVEGQTHNNNITYFGFGIDNICMSGATPSLGCNAWLDQKDSFGEELVGHLHRGNNNGLGTAIGNTFAHNYLADEVDAVASIGSIFINEEYNSPENASAYYGLTVACGAQNYSTYIGGYYSGQTGDPCMGLDVNGNRSIAVPTNGGQGNGLSQLFIGQMYGGPTNIASINGGGNMVGSWKYQAYLGLNLTTSSPTASGKSVQVDNVPAVLMNGAGVSDVTTPAAIPAGTTVTSFGGNSVNISNPVAAGGVHAGDTLSFYNPGGGPFYAIKPGMTNGDGNGFWMSKDNSTGQATSISWNGFVGAWSAGAGTYWPSGGYGGYSGQGPGYTPVFPNGVIIGGEYTDIVQARQLLFSDQLPSLDWHLQGDTAIYTWPFPGTPLIYTNASAFSPYLTAAVAVGATAVSVASCPNPALPAGTVIAVAQDVSYEQVKLGDLASCSGTTLTLQAPGAAVSATNGERLFFLRWYPSAPIANDVGGTSYRPSNVTNIASLMPCTSAAAIGLGVVTDGQTAGAAGYNAAIGAGGGGTTRLVFCDGASWTYH